ncbi:MAG: histidine phosphatase family protein [Deltaproteobacteria bacterium]|nr:histidine phosphatase family protein [Deltaproteobacteria bacterium]MBW2394102.1 histidine phosphatase family protein [Deltaproteobacteria bacterium]
MNSTVLSIVRHGETPANAEGVWHGSTDTPLSERGHSQAGRVASHLARTRADAVALYSSPLTRARHTADPISAALGLPIRIRDDLQEYHLGSWEGRTYHELLTEHRLFERMNEDPDWQPGGGESPRQVAERLSGALRAIAEAHPGDRVIVVSHAGALTLAFGLLVDDDPRSWRRTMDNTAVTDLRMSAPPELVTFNETVHLSTGDGAPA